MHPNVSSTGVTITNPLVLYRALLATNRIKPDHAQYRLALHLQKLYERLIDYEPTIEYSQRLNQLSRAIGNPDASPLVSAESTKPGKQGLWHSLLQQKERRDSLSLTRVLTSHEATIQLDSPRGLMLHGEVGTGKSMLIDLFADCLPNQKKRRWHFSTFMLEVFAKLEHTRQTRLFQSSNNPSLRPEDDHSLLVLARDMIQTSPILFLDEFQLPDRASSKIMSNLMTGFFQLGGVLIVTSNRMPEELAKAAGMEFSRPPSRLESLGWKFGIRSIANPSAQHGEFTAFLEVLKARCEIWEMNSGKDYRRLDTEDDQKSLSESDLESAHPATNLENGATYLHQTSDMASPSSSASSVGSSTSSNYPKFFKMQPRSTPGTSNEIDQALAESLHLPIPITWTPSSIRVYGRSVPVPRHYNGITHWTFAELCGNTLGPADYITLASTYHTLILTDMPVLTTLQKNEARRFITLLDALYEARCKLFLSAAAGPDDLLFPDPQPTATASSTSKSSTSQTGRSSPEEGENTDADADATYPETFSEAYQDATAPFRPNISSYSPTLAPDALEDDPPNRTRRAGSSFTDERSAGRGPDFGRTTAFTGEDERFAYKRARSRIWEMCSARWWARSEEGWWRPVSLEVRRWERDVAAPPARGEVGSGGRESRTDVKAGGESEVEEGLFRHGASPFRTSGEAPPKISWTHVWGTVRWGRRAGAWGKGPEGLGERKKGERGGGGGGDDGGKA